MRDPFRDGEDRFVARLATRFGGAEPSRSGVGIGDDAAVLPGRPARVVTTDLLVERVHFRHEFIEPGDLAGRAVEVNLSDIAAMGARPEALLLGLAWPMGDAASRTRAGRLIDGLESACRRRDVPLVGGDTTRAAEGGAVIAITAIGRVLPGGPVLRSGGRPGDRLVVTGPLGGSSAGLSLLAGDTPFPSGGRERDAAESAVSAFRAPRARLELSRLMARHARALIDLSDGLGLDLPRLADASGCGFEIRGESLPIHPGALLGGRESALAFAISGGEDYELLAAIPPERLAAARRAARAQGGRLTEIGGLLPRGEGHALLEGGERRPWPRLGWDPLRETSGLDGPRSGGVGGDERPEPARG